MNGAVEEMYCAWFESNLAGSIAYVSTPVHDSESAASTATHYVCSSSQTEVLYRLQLHGACILYKQKGNKRSMSAPSIACVEASGGVCRCCCGSCGEWPALQRSSLQCKGTCTYLQEGRDWTTSPGVLTLSNLLYRVSAATYRRVLC